MTGSGKRIDVLLVNPGSQAAVYQDLGDRYSAIEPQQASGQMYLVIDGEDVSTPELIRGIAAALGVQPRLLPCPVALLRLGAAALGRAGDITWLLGSLQVDSARIRRELGWSSAPARQRRDRRNSCINSVRPIASMPGPTEKRSSPG